MEDRGDGIPRGPGRTAAATGTSVQKKVLLAGKETDRLYIAACDPRMQEKMFRDAFDAAGFDKSRLVSLDVRNKTTEEAVEAIKDMVAPTA